MPLMVANLAHFHARRQEIVIVGDAVADDRRSLERVVFERHLPFATTILLDDSQPPAVAWLKAMTRRDGRAAAYVCEDFACKAPVTDPVALAAELDNAN